MWPPPFFGAVQPHSGVRNCVPCTDHPYAQTRVRAPLSIPVAQVPITWQVDYLLSEYVALNVSLLDFISKADYVEWFCHVAGSHKS